MNAYHLLRAAHILGGALGLASLAIPLLTKKGGRLHRRSGWVFVGSMTLGSITGLIITALWLGWPEVFKPNQSAEAVRAFALFLGSLSLLTLESLWAGLGAFTRKHSREPRASTLDVALPLILALAGIGTGALGLITARGLLVAFGAIELANAAGDLRFVLRPLSSDRAWWYQHMRAMSVAVITAVTAFLVVAMGRVIGDALPAPLQFLPWIAPSLLIVPGFIWWTRVYRRRFGEI